jgi:NitT/TauT family transport system substrate-binding protein
VASWFAKRSWLDRNRQAASAFNRAIRRANEFILRRPAEARALIPRYTRVPADLAERMPLPGFFSTVFDSDVRPVVEAAVKHGLLRRPLTPEDILVRGLR